MDTEKKFFYSNSLELAVSPYDFSLKFLRTGVAAGTTPGNAIVFVPLDEIIIAMSPGHAKAMLSGLYKSVVDYEKTIGPITIDKAGQDEFMNTFGPLLNKES
jgi:hypothetical protein